MKRRLPLVACLLLIRVILGPPRPAAAYVEVPYSLGRILQESTNVVLMRVETVDKTKNTIVYRKVRDVKGTHPGDVIKHSIGQAGFNPREWQGVMAWAEPGKNALFFHNGSAGEVCLDNYWYQCYPGEWWNMSHAEPYLLRTFAGKPDKLASAVEAMIGGQEVTVPCMVDGDKNAIQLRAARVQRLKASLKIQDYDPKRDFAGWGVEEFRAVAGMPGFTHYAALARVDPGAAGVATADVDGDGKTDFCLFGASKVVLIQNGGSSMNELRLPVEGGARAAAWADYNADGKPDLLLATPTGPRLFTNTGSGNFRDDTGGLPAQGYYNTTAAAWVSPDGKAKPDILLADGFSGLRYYRNISGAVAPPLELAMGKWFQCGPFDNTGGKGFDAVYPPEKKVDLKGEYPGKNNQTAKWQETTHNDGNQANSVKLYRDEDHTFMTVYLYREVTANQAAELPITLGNGGPLTVWLNGEKILAENVNRPPAADQVKATLKLKPGKNALLVKASYTASGRSFFSSATPPQAATVPMFEDVSDKVGLGANGAGGQVKGDHLAIADVNADGRPDVLYAVGTGLLLLNTPAGFVEAKDSGLAFQGGRVAPLFGDFDGDGKPDCFVPQADGCRLFKGDGKGHFADVTAKAGDLAKLKGTATSAAWVDFGNAAGGKGRPGLLVGCLKSPNRYFRNNGDGTFTDAGDAVGLYQRIFNTRAVSVLDFNNDGAPDVVFNNEGQESALLLGRPVRQASAVP